MCIKNCCELVARVEHLVDRKRVKSTEPYRPPVLLPPGVSWKKHDVIFREKADLARNLMQSILAKIAQSCPYINGPAKRGGSFYILGCYPDPVIFPCGVSSIKPSENDRVGKRQLLRASVRQPRGFV